MISEALPAITGGLHSQSVGLKLPDDISFKDFMALGQDLAALDRNLKWQAGDWFHFGKEKFGEQFDLALPQITNDPKSLEKAARVSERFAVEERDASLSWSHYQHLADLPHGEAAKLIDRAKSENLTARELRVETMKHKIDTGQIQIWDDDHEQKELMEITRAWNRARASVRQEFYDMAGDAELGVIDA
jgi:hypothetical protein